MHRLAVSDNVGPDEIWIPGLVSRLVETNPSAYNPPVYYTTMKDSVRRYSMPHSEALMNETMIIVGSVRPKLAGRRRMIFKSFCCNQNNRE